MDVAGRAARLIAARERRDRLGRQTGEQDGRQEEGGDEEGVSEGKHQAVYFEGERFPGLVEDVRAPDIAAGDVP